MTRPLVLLVLMLMLASLACKRKVTCDDRSIVVYAGGFDSTELANTIIERYALPGFSRLIDIDTGIETIRPIDRDSPAVGYTARLLSTNGGVNYIFRIGNRTAKLSGIEYADEEEKQPWGFGEVETCSNTVFYTFDGKPYSEKPHYSRGTTVSVVIHP